MLLDPFTMRSGSGRAEDCCSSSILVFIEASSPQSTNMARLPSKPPALDSPFYLGGTSDVFNLQRWTTPPISPNNGRRLPESCCCTVAGSERPDCCQSSEAKPFDRRGDRLHTAKRRITILPAATQPVPVRKSIAVKDADCGKLFEEE
jgi:hypothetical protein